MKKRKQGTFIAAIGCLIGFVVWTFLVQNLDVRSIGPMGTEVGFATVNGCVHAWTGVQMPLYVITDWLGLVPIGVALGFATLGLAQWIKRRSLLGVDRSLLCLGGFYVAAMAVYLLFEVVVINYRPILIGGSLEASYPSSTTVLALCVMPTAAMQFKERIKSTWLRRCVMIATVAFVTFMVVGRLLSGVHWITDIIGGILVSAGLVMAYRFFNCFSGNPDGKSI